MGIHYNVFIFDNHLGMLSGRTCEDEVERIYNVLRRLDAVVFVNPRYDRGGHCITFELRNTHPTDDRLREVWIYDRVYYREECSTELKPLDKKGKGV